MVYHIESVIRETNDYIDDGFHRLLINTTVNDGSRLARLMSNFVKNDFYDSEFPELSNQMKYFKHGEGNTEMSELMEQKYRAIREAAMAEGRAEGFAAGMEKLAALNQILISENKTNELLKASKDSNYRDELLKQYNI